MSSRRVRPTRHTRAVPHTRARRRARTLGALLTTGGLLLGPALVGCSTEPVPDAPEPTVAAPVTPAPEPEPEPVETGPIKPERPDAMDAGDADGAAAAAEYFILLYPYVMTTGDTTEWEAMSHDACESCAALIDEAQTVAEFGDLFTGGEMSIRVLEVYLKDEPTGIIPMDIRTTQEASAIHSPSGEELFAEPRSVTDHRFEMGRQDGEWVVVAIAQIPEGR